MQGSGANTKAGQSSLTYTGRTSWLLPTKTPPLKQHQCQRLPIPTITNPKIPHQANQETKTSQRSQMGIKRKRRRKPPHNPRTTAEKKTALPQATLYNLLERTYRAS